MTKFFKNHKILILILIPIYLVVWYYSLETANTDVLIPGGTTKIVDKVIIDNDFETSGTFNTVYVYSEVRPTLIYNYLAKQSNKNKVTDLSEFSTELTNKEINLSGEISYRSGLTNSIICAYNAADVNIEYHLESITVYYLFKSYADTDLEIGDEIVEINGIEVSKITSLQEFVDNGQDFQFLLDDGSVKSAKIVEIDGDNYLGVSLIANYAIDSTDIPYTVLQEEGNGNSGGYLQALDLYASLKKEDITHGYKIAGTGAISVNGEVGAIGGIEQKIVAATKDHVDIFFCPYMHYTDAINMKEEINSDMTIISVTTLQDAIDYLETLS